MKSRRDTQQPVIRDEHLRVLITCATNAAALHLAAMIAQGETFGPKCLITLHFLDKPKKHWRMVALKNELLDCTYPHLKDVLITSDPVVAFESISAAVLLAARRPDPTLAQRETTSKYFSIFKDYGLCLNGYARKDCKVLVVAEPSNTLCYICANFAPSLQAENFSALARLNHNRAIARIASELKVPTANLKNVAVWGNLWSSYHIDARFVMLRGKDNFISIKDMIKNNEFLKTVLMKHVENRDHDLNENEQQIYVLSLAKAASDQMHDWVLGTPSDTFVSMAVISDGSYNTPTDLVFSFPVEIHRGKWMIVKNLRLDEATRYKIDAAVKELTEENSKAMSCLSVGADVLDSYDMKDDLNDDEWG